MGLVDKHKHVRNTSQRVRQRPCPCVRASCCSIQGRGLADSPVFWPFFSAALPATMLNIPSVYRSKEIIIPRRR